MREILFRGKTNYEGRDNVWLYGSLLAESPSTFPIIARDYDNDEEWIGVTEWGTVDPDTVGQYTGLTDKNGKKVFEGDIVRLDEDVKMAFNVCDGEVKYGRGGFYVGDFGLLNSLNAIASCDWVLRGEVIGNIHDNPELLKGGE